MFCTELIYFVMCFTLRVMKMFIEVLKMWSRRRRGGEKAVGISNENVFKEPRRGTVPQLVKEEKESLHGRYSESEWPSNFGI